MYSCFSLRILLVCLLTVSFDSYADDVSSLLQFSESSASQFLLMVDTSEKMGCAISSDKKETDCMTVPFFQRRMTKLQQQLQKWILELPDSTEVGLGRFSSGNAAIMEPVKALGGVNAQDTSSSMRLATATIRHPDDDQFKHDGQWFSQNQQGHGQLEMSNVDNRLLFRFQQLQVPPGAYVKKAVLVFESQGMSSKETALTVTLGAEQALTQEALWLPWEAVGEFYELDITKVVREKVRQKDWCFNSAFSVEIKPRLPSDAFRVFSVSETNPSGAPRLLIQYEDSIVAPTVCAYQQAFSEISSLDKPILTTVEGGAGEAFLFSDVRFPKPLSAPDIKNISLSFRVPRVLKESTEFSLYFFKPKGLKKKEGKVDIEKRALFGPIKWVVSSLDPNEKIQSPDLSSLWEDSFFETNNQEQDRFSIGVVLVQDNREDFSEGLDAELQVDWQGLYPYAELQTQRFALLSAIAQLPQRGRVSFAEGYLEAASYWLGQFVHFGASRVSEFSENPLFPTEAQLTSLSSPFSLESKNTVLVTPKGCDGLDFRDTACRSEKRLGLPVYKAPRQFDSLICDSSKHLVLFSSSESKTVLANESTLGVRRLSRQLSGKNCGGVFNCIKNVSEILENKTAPIETHVIFSTEEDSPSHILKTLETLDMTSRHRAISLISPTVITPFYQRSILSSKVLFSLFQPSSTVSWLGNIKPYQLDVATGSIVDKQGLPALETTSRESSFKSTSTSLWSRRADGKSVLQGGVNAQLKRAVQNNRQRKLSTFTGEYTPPTQNNAWASIPKFSSKLNSKSSSSANLHVLENSLDLKALNSQVVTFLGGGEKKLEDDDGLSGTGAFLHSKPVAVRFGPPDSPAEIIFASSNQGLLHAFDLETGEELMAFMPQELVPRIERWFQREPNQVSEPLQYGLDASWTVWRHDAFKQQDDGRYVQDGVITTALSNAPQFPDEDKVMLFGGMRRGGHQVYGLDVTSVHSGNTDVKINPKLSFVLKGGEFSSVPPDSPYRRFGQTWSQPTLAQVRLKVKGRSQIRPVIVFGGGYDDAVFDIPPEDNLVNKPITRGNAIYMVDAENGALLWWASRVSGDQKHQDLRYSVASQLRALDLNGDGLTDRLYFADIRGQVFRVVFDNGEMNHAISARSFAQIEKIAELSKRTGIESRRYFLPPSIAMTARSAVQGRLALAFGSGSVPHPLSRFVQNTVTVIFDEIVLPKNPLKLIKGAELPELDLATTKGVELSSKSRGWQLRLASRAINGRSAKGEKILAAPLFYQGQLLVSSFIPAAAGVSPVDSMTHSSFGSNNSCSVTKAQSIGRTRFYVLDAEDGSATEAFKPFTGGAVLGRGRFIEMMATTLSAEPQVISQLGIDSALLVGTEVFKLNQDLMLNKGRHIRTRGWRSTF